MVLNLIQLSPNVHAVQQQSPEMIDYEDLYLTDSGGKLPVMYHMRLDESEHPTLCAPRRILVAMKDKVFNQFNQSINIYLYSTLQQPKLNQSA
ncbi:hypothetical protein QQF64_017028 [Cirrhinus molitorella]|uniref:Uncharacterized protein n=1 Tax=Cirrhinus molitorella TaxID=172907 RepID=A0ABR3LHM1_9TELE